MPLIAYQSIKFQPETEYIIGHANTILSYFAGRSIIITLRQLYYQFVAKDLFPQSWADPKTGSTNNIRSYKRLGDMVNNARLCGFIDWDYLEDTGRNLRGRPHWSSPSEAVDSLVSQYGRDLWLGQDNYVEVWVEKDALMSIVGPICQQWDVPHFACRGYVSQSEMWGAGQRYHRRIKQSQSVHILHFGDHDPSGMDMTRDIEDRIQMFAGHHTAVDIYRANPQPPDEDREVWKDRIRDLYISNMSDKFTMTRVALNMDQVEEYGPPPNPAKLTDSRCNGYIQQWGEESWELDALDPEVLEELVTSNISRLITQQRIFTEQQERQEFEREQLRRVSIRWDDIQARIDAEY